MRIVKTIALAFGLALVTVNFAWADWSGAAAEQYISLVDSIYPGAYQVYCPSLAAAPNGDLYTIWAQGSYPTICPREIHFSKSTDDGVTWSGTAGDQMISANDGEAIYNMGLYGSRRTDIAVDSQGRIYVVWPEDYMSYPSFDTTIEIMMVMSTDGGTTWIHSDTDFPIGDTLSDPIANSPNIGIDSNDNVFVVWNQTNPASGAAEIALSVSTDNGATWSGRTSDRFISLANGNSSSAPDIAVDIAGKIHVVWIEYIVSGDYRVLYGISTDNGATFSSETSDQAISFAPYSIVFPRITTGPIADYVHVIYAQNDTAMYVGSTDGGTTWNETMVYGGQSYDMDSPDIGVTSTGMLVAIIDEEYPGSTNSQVFASYSFDNGATWSVTLDLASNFDPVPTFDRTYIPTLAITDDDVLHVTYSTNIRPSSNSYQEMCYTMNDSLGALQGIITGIVTELDEVTPIDSVEVSVYGGGDNLVGTDTTDLNGEFTFSLSPHTYYATFSKTYYNDTTLTDLVVVAYETTMVNLMMYLSGYAYLPGDVNMALGIWPPQCIGGDVTYLVGYFIGGGQASCNLDGFWASADINGDCTIIGGDVTALVGYFVAGGSLVPCPDYEPLWLPLPPEAPEGWPNCDTPVINSRVIPTNPIR